MPARNMFFTFDTKVKVNKETVSQFTEFFKYFLQDNFKEIKEVFEVDSIDVNFLKEFINQLKSFNSVSDDGSYELPKKIIVKNFIRDILGDETKQPSSVLGIKYLYDEWDYEGCGYNDHYHYTYIDDSKMIKKTIKETEKLVKKLVNLGVDAKLIIK